MSERNKIIQYAMSSFLIIVFTSCALFQPSTKKMYKRAFDAHKQYDAIIVPGVPFYAPTWDSIMKMRVLWAVHLYNNGSTKKIMMTGGSVYSPYVEAEIMKLYAIALGVPEKDILVESKAEHTTENIWYSYKLGRSKGFTSMAFASDPFQTKLTYRFIKKRVKGVQCIPVIFDTLKTLPHPNPVINYEPLKIDSFRPITETQTFRYRWRGTRGKNINYNE